MLGARKERRPERLVPISLEAAVPPDHFYRYLDAKLDLGFVRDWVSDCYAERGRPSIDPVVFFKLQLVMFFEGVRSERQLLRVVADRLSVRWYLGYDLDEPLHDHSSLTRIRTRLGLPIFQRFFAHIVELCQQAGLVWGKELIMDSTKVPANADYDSLTPRWYLRAKAHLTDLFADDAPTEGPRDAPAVTAVEESASATDVSATDGEPLCRLAFPGTMEEEQQLAAANQTMWRLLERLRLDPERPATRGYQRKTDLRVSTTDPDAAPIQTGVKPTLGYRDHYVVDGGRARIILNAVVLPGDIMDNTPLPDLLWRARLPLEDSPKAGGGGRALWHDGESRVAGARRDPCLYARPQFRRAHRLLPGEPIRVRPKPGCVSVSRGTDAAALHGEAHGRRGDVPRGRGDLQCLPGEGRLHDQRSRSDAAAVALC